MENQTQTLSIFSSANKQAEVLFKDEKAQIFGPWGKKDILLSFLASDTFLQKLDNIKFDSRFLGIFHNQSNTVELVFGFLPEDHSKLGCLFNRTFEVNFEGNSVKCFFAPPSADFLKICASAEIVPSDDESPIAPRLMMYRDFQSIPELTEYKKKFFKDKKPLNFFIRSSKNLSEIDIANLARHINFLISYYDNESPIIDIRDEDVTSITGSRLRYINGSSIPEKLTLRQIDDVILKLIEAARYASPRLSIIYYYQVLEFASFHYIDHEVKAEIKRILREPTVTNGDDVIFSRLYSILTEKHQDDDVKIKRVIEEYCDPSLLWREISCNIEFFSKPHNFEGGFCLEALISPTTDEKNWCAMWTPKLFDQIKKIRNALVHAREKREKNVILPSQKNNFLLNNYLPLIERVAYQIAIKAD